MNEKKQNCEWKEQKRSQILILGSSTYAAHHMSILSQNTKYINKLCKFVAKMLKYRIMFKDILTF